MCSATVGSWAKLVVEDLEVLSRQSFFLGLPSPLAPGGSEAWLAHIQADPGRWQRRVRQFKHEQVASLRFQAFAESADPIADAKLAAQLVRSNIVDSTQVDPEDELSIAELAVRRPHICRVCSSGFPSARLLGVHLRSRHGLPSEARLYASGTICAVCGVQFHSLARLVRHLQRHPSCLPMWKTMRSPLGEAERADAEAELAKAKKVARSSGAPLLAAFLPAMRL